MNRVLVTLLMMFAAIASSATDSASPKDVDLSAPDGTKLKATYYAAAKPGPGILLMHQCNGQRKQWAPLAQKLVDAGFNVLTVDYRGFGESGGPDYNSMTPPQRQQILADKWPGDMDAAFQYLVSQPGVDKTKLGAGGASCGVNQAVQVARRHPEVKSLVLLSGTTDRAGRQFLRTTPKLTVFGSAADDDAGAPELIQWILAAAKNPANQFQHYKTGGHGYEMFPAHPELIPMIVQWYDDTLRKPSDQLKAGNVKPSDETNVLELLETPDGVPKVKAMLATKDGRTQFVNKVPEPLVNVIGYDYLQGKDAKTAIEVMKLNVDAFPQSANAYDSLSDAYLADGQKELARTNAEKSIALLDKDATMPEARKKLIRESAEKKLGK